MPAHAATHKLRVSMDLQDTNSLEELCSMWQQGPRVVIQSSLCYRYELTEFEFELLQ